MWEKIKFWTRVVIFGLLALYVIVVTLLNWNLHINGDLDLVFVKYKDPQVLKVLFFTALISIFGWWLMRTVWRALRQLKSAKEKSRTARLEREVAEMKAKAGMLQSKDGGGVSVVTPAESATNEPNTP
jgi:hypothetical protein